MAYSITNTDGTVAITVADATIDSSTYSVDLIGRNASNYGPSTAKNAIRLLENYASETAPSPGTKLVGQLWYDKAESILKIWNGSVWKRIDTPVLSSAPVTSIVTGTKYFNTTNKQEYTYDGSSFRLSNYAGEISSAYRTFTAIGEPQKSYGTKLKTIYLRDSAGTPKAVTALVYVNDSTTAGFQGATAHPNLETNETIMAIISPHSSFTIGNGTSTSEGQNINYYPELSSPNSIGVVINGGLNLRNDYTQSSVALADLATLATTANVLYHSGRGVNISADPSDSAYFYSNIENIVPSTDNTFDIGTTAKTFQTTHTNKIVIGNSGGTTGEITPTGNNTVQMGTSTLRFGGIYTKDLDVSGNVSFGLGIQNIGSAGSPAENTYTANLVANGSIVLNNFNWPAVSTPAANTALLTDGSNNLSFQTIPLVTTQMIAGAGLTGGGTLAANRTFNVGAGSYIIVAADTVAVDATSTNTASKVVARDASGNFAAGVITATATQARYADLAEKYEADADYEPGTVVKLGGTKEITQTNSHADTEVFGVISTDPAYLMNADSVGLPVALQGRVPVRVIGKVKKGERLVSSDMAGVAWALGEEQYDARAVIGRSLADKNDGGYGIVEAVIGVK